MNAIAIDHVETNVERGASALLAGAVGFAVYGTFGDVPLQPELGLGIGVAAIIAYFLSKGVLQSVADRDRGFTMRAFDVREIETIDDALILTEDDRVGATELVLTAEDRMHPGELKTRIDGHLQQAPARPLSDASQALSDALAELRRSLR